MLQLPKSKTIIKKIKEGEYEELPVPKVNKQPVISHSFEKDGR
jgi:hypothetical protein